MYPHRIRLRGPWQLEPLGRLAPGAATLEQNDLPSPRTAIMPARWKDCGLENFRGTVRHRRHFSRPRKLDEHERVWITCAGIANRGEISLNGERLAGCDRPMPSFEVEVTGKLQERNELCIDVYCDDDNGGCGEVALEIRALAWLGDLQILARIQGAFGVLQVNGAVVGRSDMPLDLYVLWDRTTVLQETVLPSETGMPFLATTREISPDRDEHSVRVELVHGASVWYSVEQTMRLND
jgi:hypothetical protein